MKAERLVTEFATSQKLKWRIDEGDDTTIIQGRAGQIYQWDEHLLAVMYISETGTPAKWNHARRACLAAGMTLLQDADSEGSLSFDPMNREQAKLAIKVAQVKNKRVLSPEALDMAKQRMANARKARQTQSTGHKNALLSDEKPFNDPIVPLGSGNPSEGGFLEGHCADLDLPRSESRQVEAVRGEA